MDVRVDAARGQDQPLARDRLRRHADDHASRDAGHHVGIARLADPGNPAALDADVRLAHAGPVDDQGIGDDTVERVGVGHACGLPHPVAQHLAAPELALVAIHRRVAFDLGHQAGVAEPDAIAGGGPVDAGVVPSVHAVAHDVATPPSSRPGVTGPLAQALPPWMTRRPAIATSRTRLVSPGSKRTAVPAGMSSRIPYACARSK